MTGSELARVLRRTKGKVHGRVPTAGVLAAIAALMFAGCASNSARVPKVEFAKAEAACRESPNRDVCLYESLRAYHRDPGPLDDTAVYRTLRFPRPGPSVEAPDGRAVVRSEATVHGQGTPVYPASACIGAVVNGVCHGSILSTDPMPKRCYGQMIGGRCTGPMF